MKVTKNNSNFNHNDQLDDIDKPSLSDTIRVLIVDDSWLILKGLQSTLTGCSNIKIVGSANNGKEAIKQCHQVKPDIVILDLTMPVMGGIEATKEIKKQFPETKVLILSSFENDETITEVLVAGASGYLLKSAISEDLVIAVTNIHRGSYHFAQGIMSKLLMAAQGNLNSNDVKETNEEIELTNSTKTHSSSTIANTKKSKITHTKNLKAVNTSQSKKFKFARLITTQAKTVSVANSLSKRAQQLASQKLRLLPLEGGIIVVISLVFALVSFESSYFGYASLFLLITTLLAHLVIKFLIKSTNYPPIITVNVAVFFTTIAHIIYEAQTTPLQNFSANYLIDFKNHLGIWLGISSLLIITFAVYTSSRSNTQKSWHRLFWLSFPAIVLALLHTATMMIS